MTSAVRTAATVAVALLLAGPSARADERRGIELTRAAQEALAAGDAEEALRLLQEARIEWPGSAIVTNTLADAQRQLGQLEEAARQYERGMRDGCEHHARFNRGVTLHEQAEQALQEAGVPADAAALPEGPQPALLQSIRAALQPLSAAREDFLAALDLRDEPSARESLAALNRRIDALRRMEEELASREPPDEKPQKNQDPQQDQQQPPQDQEGQESQDQPPQDGQQDQPPEQPGDDQPPEPEPQQQESSGEEESQDGQEGQEGQPPPEDVPPALARELSKEEVQQMLDKLEELEKQGRLLQKQRQAAQHREVEKDW